MKKKKINLNRLKNKFKMQPLFDDREFYERVEREDYDDISAEELEKEIDELVAKMRKDMMKK